MYTIGEASGTAHGTAAMPLLAPLDEMSPTDAEAILVVLSAEEYWLSYAPYRDGGAYFGFLSVWIATSPIPVPGGPHVAPLLNPALHIPLDETLVVTFHKYVWMQPNPRHGHFYGPMALIRTRLHQTGRDVLCITSLRCLAAFSLLVHQEHRDDQTIGDHLPYESLKRRLDGQHPGQPLTAEELMSHLTAGHGAME